MTSISSNYPKLYAMVILRWSLLIMPILILFFQDNGLTMKQILLLQSIFSVAVLVFEIPSGYFSDVVGRRRTLIAGTIMATIGWGIYAFSSTFSGFLIAEMIMGLGGSLISGTDSAILCDTLAEENREKEYMKLEGRLSSLGNFSEATGAIIGGLLAGITLRTPFYVQAGLIALTIPLAFSIVEPRRECYQSADGNWKGILRIVRYCLHDHCEVKWLILYSAFVGSSTLTIVWFIQPYFSMVGLPLPLFGVLWAPLNLSVGVFSLTAHRFEALVGRKKALIGLIVLSAMASMLVAMVSALWGILFLFIFYFVRGIQGPVLKDYINRHITSDIRATVLSVKNMIARLIFAVVGPFIGWVADAWSLQTAFAVSGSIFLVGGILALIFLRKHKGL